MGLGRRNYANNLGNNSSFDNAYSAFLNTLDSGGEPIPAKRIQDFSKAELFFLQNAGFNDLVSIPQGNFDDEVPSIVGDSLTVTGGGNGSLFDKDGLLVTELPNNRPRPTFDPVTGEYQGVYVEVEDTNNLTYSNDYTSEWDKTRVDNIPNYSISPEGVLNASKVAYNNVSSFGYMYRSFAPNIQNYKLSIFVKNGNFTSGNISVRFFDFTTPLGFAVFDLENKTTSTTTGQYSNLEIKEYNNDWFLISLNYNSLQTTVENIGLIFFNKITSLGDFMNFYGANISNHNTSFIKTIESTVTRPADTYTATGAISGSSYGIFVRDQLGKRIDYFHDGNKYTYRNGTLESTIAQAPSTDLVISSFTGSDIVKTIALRLGTMSEYELQKITA